MSQSKETICDEQIQNIIHHWYMVKDISLQGKKGGEGPEGEGLIMLMEKRHGFTKSKAQYERLFRDWNWVKNQTKGDYEIVRQKTEERRKRGRDTDVYLKGELVPKKKLKKEISRQTYKTTAERISQVKQPIPSTPPGFDIRTPAAEPLLKLIFHKLPILEFQRSVHDLQTFVQPNSIALRNPGSLLSKIFENQPIFQSFADAVLPNSALLAEPQAYGLASRNVGDLSHTQFLNLASFLLSNNLPGDADGGMVYEWMKDQGGMGALTMLSSIQSPTAKSLLESLFRLAVEAGNTPVVKHLLQAGVNPNGHQCKYKYPENIPSLFDPLQVACLHGDFDMAKDLLQAGSKIDEEEMGFKSSLLVLVIIGGNRGRKGPNYPFDPGDKLKQDAEGARFHKQEEHAFNERQPNVREEEVRTMNRNKIPCLNEINLLDLVKTLVKAGAKINPAPQAEEEGRFDYFQSPLSAASKYLNTTLVRYLTGQGADVKFLTSRNSSVLQECLFCWERIVAFSSRVTWEHRMQMISSEISKVNTIVLDLLDAGANPDSSPMYTAQWNSALSQYSILDLAAVTGSLGLVEELIARGAITTRHCLEFALRSSRLSIFRCLLRNGILNITWEGMKMLMANDEARREWTKEFSKGAGDAQTKEYAMFAAIRYGSIEMMDLILKFEEFEWVMLAKSNSEEYDESKSMTISPYEDRHATLLEIAVAQCARNGRLEVFQEIARRKLIPTSMMPQCLDVALLHAIMADFLPPDWACLNGNLKLVQKLIIMEANVNAKFYHQSVLDGCTGTILVTAMGRGNDLIIEELIKAGANINALGYDAKGNKPEGMTPLTAAIRSKNEKWINYLMKAGFDLNNPPGITAIYTPLEAAIDAGNFDIFHLLLGRGAHLCDEHFMAACKDPSASHFFHRLLHEEYARDSVMSCARSALVRAISDGSTRTVSLFLERKLLDVNFVWCNTRPLFHALKCQHNCGTGCESTECRTKLEIVRMLLHSGADPNLPVHGVNDENFHPLLPLLLAASRGKDGAVGLLLQNGALPNPTGPGSCLTALHLAVHHRNDRMARMLLNYGANPNVHLHHEHSLAYKNADQRRTRYFAFFRGYLSDSTIAELRKNTPLQIAARIGCKEIAETLIAHGASVNAPPAEQAGATALQYAAIHGYLGIVVLLHENGAEVNAAPAVVDGRTALEGAAENGRLDIVQLLLNAGADIYGERQVQYERALEFASNNGHHALRELLEEHHG